VKIVVLQYMVGQLLIATWCVG